MAFSAAATNNTTPTTTPARHDATKLRAFFEIILRAQENLIPNVVRDQLGLEDQEGQNLISDQVKYLCHEQVKY